MECLKSTKSDKFILDVYIHIMILVVILSIGFWVLIAPTEKKSFEREINSQMKVAISGILDENPTITKDLKSGLPIFKTMSKYYSRPDSTTQDYNTWLKRVNILVIVILIVNFLFLWLLLRFSCGRCVPVRQVFAENIFLFICIGIIEVIFFLKVASKFIPVTPSFMVDRIIDDIKNKL